MRIIVCVGVVAVLLAAAGCEPQDRRPGAWVSGKPMSEPISDWSFVRNHDEIFVETQTWYGVPHSVTTTLAEADGVLYVPSIYRTEQPWPEEKYWTSNIERNPDVRLKIGDRILERRAIHITDPAEFDTALAALAAKYGFWKELQGTRPEDRPNLHMVRMDPRQH